MGRASVVQREPVAEKDDAMSKQTIGPRELALRDMRAAQTVKPARAALAAELPKTSGVKPVKKRKAKR